MEKHQRHEADELIEAIQARDDDQDPAELDNPNVDDEDLQPGFDRPEQRPVSDNKAGG